jgi:hypothetical protein
MEDSDDNCGPRRRGVRKGRRRRRRGKRKGPTVEETLKGVGPKWTSSSPF